MASFQKDKYDLINNYINDSFARFSQTVSQRFAPLLEAMKYSLGGSGKRLRPILTLSSAEYLGIDPSSVLPAACALEYIHSYSLVHDDLPSMDDDDTRRGLPSSHKKFGEAVAILAGDALLTEAFGQMSLLAEKNTFSAERVLHATQLLAQQAGVAGMVGGQLLDVTIDPLNSNLPELEFIHIHKTGALLVTSVLIPAKLINASEEQTKKLRRYGESLGLAFQISDDLLDSEAQFRYSRGPRKKAAHSYIQYCPATEARERLNDLVQTAIECVQDEGKKATSLIEIANFVRNREN